MGKRSTGFERKPRDLYQTWDPNAYPPLLRFLPPETRFAEPCAGDGELVRHIEAAGHVCVDAADIHPLTNNIRVCDAREFRCPDAAVFITNPPYVWPLVGEIISALMVQRPTWMLLEADWTHNKRCAPLMMRCSMLVSIGRLRWERGTKSAGKQNYVWACFDDRLDSSTQFFGRV